MLPTVKDVCVLNEGALNIRISDGVERIDEDTLQLSDGSKFFLHSHLTAGMVELVREGFKRLSGNEGGRPVFRLKQAMGGGKTHLIRAMAFLARHPQLRADFFPETAARYSFESARVCFFNGREQPDDFFWGRIASQLGHPGFFEAGVKSPGEEHWNQLFEKVKEPILIMLDEMPPYFAYYRTQAIGQGTVSDVAGRAFANMLSSAIGKKNVCIIVSDLEASHADGTQIINAALDNARKELSRVEFNITPVDLSGDETYAILRKRLFQSLPDSTQIAHIAQQFAISIENAQKSRTIDQQKSPEQLALEVEQTYPFHPQMKHLFALFKENKEFQQTRGLMELASRLIRSVWERQANDVLLIGPQHFDLSIDDVREKVVSISRLDDAVAKDIYSSDGGAHAQTIDANSGNDAATQIANLILISSLSTAVNPVKGLTQSETLECLATPNGDLSFFQEALESLLKSCWYLHKSAEGRIYFDKLENLTKMLSSLADRAPEPKVKELVAHRLTEMFQPKRKSAYQKVLALPLIDEIQADVQSGRVLAIITPDSKLPPDEVVKLFDGLTRKNNLIVLTGEKSFEMSKLWEAARSVFAANQAEQQRRVRQGGPQWEEFEEMKKRFEQHFTGIVKTLFDKLFFPFQRPGNPPQLMPRPLEPVGDTNEGESRVEATLSNDPIKLYSNWVDGTSFSGVRSRIERLFNAQDDIAWSDIREKIQTDCSMYFLPPGDLEKIKARAINEAYWEDLGNGWVTKKPRPKEATVSVVPLGRMDLEGATILEVTIVNSRVETTTVHYQEDGEVSEKSPKLSENRLSTKALRVAFLAVDHSGITTSAKPVIWSNRLLVQHEVAPTAGQVRTVRLQVLPRAGVIKYTLNGAEARNGLVYSDPFTIDEHATMLMVFAEADGLEEKATFNIPLGGEGAGAGDSGENGDSPPGLMAKLPPLGRPVTFPSSKQTTINSRDKVFLGIAKATQRGILFKEVMITVADGHQTARLQLLVEQISAQNLSDMINALVIGFTPTASLTLKFGPASFPTGQDLIDFCEEVALPFDGEWEEI